MFMRIWTILAVLVASAAASRASQVPLHAPSASETSTNATSSQVLTPEFNKFIQEVVTNGTIPGLTLGIVHPGGGVELGAWGQKTEDGDAMTVDTLFYLASCSKAFLSASVGILMDDFAHGWNNTPLPHGITRFDWYSKVKDILPGEWGLMDEWANEKATFRDILSHQSGLPGHDLSYAGTDTSADIVHRMRHLRPAFELRQRYNYNNQMYILGSYVITKYSGMPYTDFVKRRIFAPLNMTSSTYLPSEALRDGKLTQVWNERGRRIPLWATDETTDINAGPGGVISSVAEMVQWIATLLNSGIGPSTNTTVVPRDVFEMTTTSHALVTNRGEYSDISAKGYGMGWGRFAYQGHEIVGHSGGAPGTSSHVWFLPWDDFGLVVLSNADEKYESELLISFRVIEDYFGLEHTQSERIRKTLQSQMKDGSPANQGRLHSFGCKSSSGPDAQLWSALGSLTGSAKTATISNHSLATSHLLPLTAYAGAYADPGYGLITLCAPSSISPTCQLALEQFAHFDNVTTDDDRLYAVLRSAWVPHARLFRRLDWAGGESGNMFAIAATRMYPNGYGRDTSPFESWEEGSVHVLVEFLVEEREGKREVAGMGLRGLAGETMELERQGGGLKQTAEVWFTKL